MEETKSLQCAGCDVVLNAVQQPRVFDDDLDPRDAHEQEWCGTCYREGFEYCSICGEDVGSEDLCRHLFWDTDGLLHGPGSDQAEANPEKYIKPGFKKLIREICHAELMANTWNPTWGVDARANTVLSNMRHLQRRLVANDLRIYTTGSIFSVESLTFENRSFTGAANHIYWTVGSSRLYQTIQQTRDAGAWLLCLGHEDTAKFNAQAAAWIEEILPFIEKCFGRYAELKFKQEQIVCVR